ncbi:ATP-binding cassette sub-family G member 1-like [Pollicipes pollicipes]|uniref:ATP-binding cassette sub-family G member 1-like n=1 Tax=Pollicipes pollicipes TaxID=41117 RepID=UPI0018859BBB|nr:ATP-binding cassette sub-family G member 1-like [Pollicipes pollicipes]
MFSKLPQSQPVTIEFNDLSYKVAAPRPKGQVKKEWKTILDGVTGTFRPGQLTAIMGPSGAGKSTLLNVLAGYKVRNVEGSIKINGAARNLQTFRKIQAYIMQDDYLLPYISVDEAMMAAANLKLGAGFTHQSRRQVVDDVLETLGLSSCGNTRCLRLSGGQRKRLSIALELLNNPPVMFFDEPTSGLDSTSCSSCVSLLKTLSQGGRTIICTIHQPSSRLFQQFDQLYILSRGSCIYRGTRSNLVPALAAAGLDCPGYHNPADFVIEAASGEYGDWTSPLVEAAQNGRSRTWSGPDPLAGQFTADDFQQSDETDFAISRLANGELLADGKSNGGSQLHHQNSSPLLQNGSSSHQNGPSLQQNFSVSHLSDPLPRSNDISSHHSSAPANQSVSSLPQYVDGSVPRHSRAAQHPNGAAGALSSAPGSPLSCEADEPCCTSRLLEEQAAGDHAERVQLGVLCPRLEADVGARPLDPVCRLQRLDSGRELYRTTATTQFCVLLKRTCKSIVRDPMLTMARLASHLLFGLLIGSLYFRIGNEAKDVYNNAAQLFFALMFLLFSALMPTILTFPLEMSVFKKEYMNCWYSVKSYYLAKTLADLPFQIAFPVIYDAIVYFMTSQPLEWDRFCMFCLMTILTSLVAQSVGLVIGACCGIQLAVFLGPVTMIPIILFSGFFVNLNTIPVWLSWVSYISYARYSFQGLMLSVYGFGREDMHCSLPYCHFRSPEKFLKEMDMLDADYWTDVAVLCAMTVCLRLIGYFVLRWKLKMER